MFVVVRRDRASGLVAAQNIACYQARGFGRGLLFGFPLHVLS
jgi:hypothetical protein